MIRLLFASIAIMSAAPIAAFAQAAPAPLASTAPAPASGGVMRHHHGNRYLTAVHSLTLTSAQQQQIAGFVRDTHAANHLADPQTRRANTQKLHTEIDGVLTADQRTQLQALLPQRTKPVAQ